MTASPECTSYLYYGDSRHNRQCAPILITKIWTTWHAPDAHLSMFSLVAFTLAHALTHALAPADVIYLISDLRTNSFH